MSALEAITTYFGLPTGIPNDDVLTMMIERACDPRLHEPDLAANLDICDYINKKKQNTPHDVSNFLVQLINHRDSEVAMLALMLLDTCIRNCGYAFHLQIARKEFLNELVKKFPEQPPNFPNRVQVKILEFINEWKLGLASQARFKSDFRKIQELHTILVFKGYKFPSVKPDRLSSLVSKPALCSAEELEEADKETLSAKLQEHIRRGTPADLVKANELMKLLSGYEVEKKPDYQSIVERQLTNVERSIEILSSQLIPGVDINRNLRDLYNECNAAQVKIQKLILEEEEGAHAVRLFELNDRLNELNQQFDNACKGIFIDEPIRFQVEQPPEVSSHSKAQAEETGGSLIDLDDTSETPSSSHRLHPLNRAQSHSVASSNGSQLPAFLLDGIESLNFDTQSSSMTITPAPSTPRAIQLNSADSSPLLPSREVSPSTLSPPVTGFSSKISGLDTVKHADLFQTEFIKVSTSSYIQDKIAYIQFDFYNQSSSKIDQLDLKLAVPKGLTTVISGITGTFLMPHIGHVSLPVEIHFTAGSSSDVKYRYILTFQTDGQSHTHQGEVRAL